MRDPRLILLSVLLGSIVQVTGAAAQDFDFPLVAADLHAGSGVMAPCRPAETTNLARCGTFRVWEDRERGSGRTVDIAFVVLEATGAEAERSDDAIILLPGGPGETFTGAAADVARDLRELNRTRDILLVDVRGVGRSDALDCDVPFTGGLRSRFGQIFPAAHIAACREDLGRRANLALYTTAAAVDDLEQLRAWLGYSRLNLIGGSYGTRVAQVYMRRHPASVRTAVLNGVVPLETSSYVNHARLLQRTLDRVVAGCRADARCRLAHPDLEVELQRLLERLRARPVEVEIAGQTVPFGAGDLAYALRGLLYGRAAEVPALISEAAAGELAPLVEYYLQRTAWIEQTGGSAGYHFSVLCAEDVAPLTDEDVARATAGTFMGAHLIDGYRAVCAEWPYARLPASHWTPLRTDTPTLLLSGSLDPVTPPEDAEAVASHLPNSLHIVVPGGGHGVGGPCVDRLVLQFIETATVRGLDPSCIPG